MQNAIALPQQQRRTDRKLLFAAAGLGLLAAVLAIVYLNSAKKTETVQVASVPVVVAVKDIASGQKVTADLIAVRQIAQPDAVAGGFSKTDQVLDKTVRYPVS